MYLAGYLALLGNMAILSTVQNAGSQRADAVRIALGELVNRLYPGGWKEAAPDLGYPYKTFWRNLTVTGEARNNKVDLAFVLDVYEQLRDKFPGKVDEFVDFYAHATRHIS